MVSYYDVVVIGSGTGGQTAAFYLKEKGLDVALIEKADRPGGTCALHGCQPKKWFYEVAEAVAASRHLEGKGIISAARADWGRVMEQKRQFTDRVPERTVKNFQEAGIEFVAGTASFLNGEMLRVNGKKIQSRFFILATGAEPVKLDIDGREHVITSDEFLELSVLPPSIVFIGEDLSLLNLPILRPVWVLPRTSSRLFWKQEIGRWGHLMRIWLGGWWMHQKLKA